MPNLATLVSAAAGSGRFIPDKPTLQYAGSGTSNNGKFTILNHNATFIYSVSGSGSISGNVLTVTAGTGSAVLTARSPKGFSFSPGVTALRQVATQFFTQTGSPFCCSSGSCASCFGGCGTFYGQDGFCPGCAAGFYSCGTPGFFSYTNYGPSGYTWSGNDFNNGSGEWWRIV